MSMTPEEARKAMIAKRFGGNKDGAKSAGGVRRKKVMSFSPSFSLQIHVSTILKSDKWNHDIFSTPQIESLSLLTIDFRLISRYRVCGISPNSC